MREKGSKVKGHRKVRETHIHTEDLKRSGRSDDGESEPNCLRGEEEGQSFSVERTDCRM